MWMISSLVWMRSSLMWKRSSLVWMRFFYIFFIVFALGGSPTPHPISLPTSLLYVNLVAMGTPKRFKTWVPKITLLVFPGFADAYSCTTASYRLTQLPGQIPENSQTYGADIIPLLHFELVSDPDLIFRIRLSRTPQAMHVYVTLVQ